MKALHTGMGPSTFKMHWPTLSYNTTTLASLHKPPRDVLTTLFFHSDRYLYSTRSGLPITVTQTSKLPMSSTSDQKCAHGMGLSGWGDLTLHWCGRALQFLLFKSELFSSFQHRQCHKFFSVNAQLHLHILHMWNGFHNLPHHIRLMVCLKYQDVISMDVGLQVSSL